MMMKVPGSGRLKLMPRKLDLRYNTAFSERTPDAYERLLTDVMRGDQTLFMRRDEVEAAWAFIDPILEGWSEFYPVPHRYMSGSSGPTQAIAMIERENRSWSKASSIPEGDAVHGPEPGPDLCSSGRASILPAVVHCY